MIPLKDYSDTDLIFAYQQSNDSFLFGELYNRYYQKVFLYAVKILKNHDEALDLTQDLFIKVAIKISKLKEPVTFVSWLFRIAHNDCIERLRKSNKKRTLSLDNCFNIGEESLSQDCPLEKEEQFNQLEKVLTLLPKKDQKILTEKYLENKTIIDLMKTYGLSESAIKMRLSRSRDKIKGLMEVA